ncbi:hypothetical protein BJ742DRAFT_828564 [Cladochytrium replicatum]|nr:hypothetical protein BJ742DRAFT_828564 [Cladochytrium replicatum]
MFKDSIFALFAQSLLVICTHANDTHLLMEAGHFWDRILRCSGILQRSTCGVRISVDGSDLMLRSVIPFTERRGQSDFFTQRYSVAATICEIFRDGFRLRNEMCAPHSCFM